MAAEAGDSVSGRSFLPNYFDRVGPDGADPDSDSEFESLVEATAKGVLEATAEAAAPAAADGRGRAIVFGNSEISARGAMGSYDTPSAPVAPVALAANKPKIDPKLGVADGKPVHDLLQSNIERIKQGKLHGRKVVLFVGERRWRPMEDENCYFVSVSVFKERYKASRDKDSSRHMPFCINDPKMETIKGLFDEVLVQPYAMKRIKSHWERLCSLLRNKDSKLIVSTRDFLNLEYEKEKALTRINRTLETTYKFEHVKVRNGAYPHFDHMPPLVKDDSFQFWELSGHQ